MTMNRRIFSQITCVFLSVMCAAQAPLHSPTGVKYTPKHLLTKEDSTEFRSIPIQKNGFFRLYGVFFVYLNDTDDDNTTMVKDNGSYLLVCIEGTYKNGLQEGITTHYVIDGLDHSKRYKILEKSFHNGKLNGKWTGFDLKGTMIGYQTFKNDTLYGLSRDYWMDGISLMEESVYQRGGHKYTRRVFNHKTNQLMEEQKFDGAKPNGKGKKFYGNGVLQEEYTFRMGKSHGIHKYYHANGQLWFEERLNEGKRWDLIANYDSKGHKRDGGTLKHGNGTIILYDDDDKTVWKVLTYKDGDEITP